MWCGVLWLAPLRLQLDDAGCEPGSLASELVILATAANQLFQSTPDMSPDAQVRVGGAPV
jgi:hypothetical protein